MLKFPFCVVVVHNILWQNAITQNILMRSRRSNKKVVQRMLLQENDFSEIKKKVIIRGNDSRPKKYSAREFLRLIGSVVGVPARYVTDFDR